MDAECAPLVRSASLVLSALAAFTPQSAPAEPICAICEIQIGLGGTYHFWGSTGGVVLPVTVTWSQNRYEVGVFRFTTSQTLSEFSPAQRPMAMAASDRAVSPPRSWHRLMAEPYWGLSASRRWQLFAHGPLQGFVGFGLALRSESDVLSATHWDFASQLGVRWHRSLDHTAIEFTIRHWSNGGCELPNHGQDFATLTVRFNP